MIRKDNIYNNIKIDKIAESIIKTKEFQRLRKIKQLGFSSMTLSGANHTRFEHSLGVYHLGCSIMQKHNKKGEIASSLEEKEFKIACLLHDIGHGPFSHTSESFYNFCHEKIGIEILQNKDGEIYKILKKNRILDGVCDIIAKNHTNIILNKLLSSGVDVDRLDYLNRDSFYTNFTYGKIKVEDITDNIKFNENLISPIFFEKENKLILENFIMSRYYMFSEVYLADSTRIIETVLQYILQAIKEQSIEKKSKTQPYILNNISPKEILNLTDDKFLDFIDEQVLKINDKAISFLWNLIQTDSIDKLKIVKKEEDADIIVPKICKKIIDDKNTVFIFEDGKYKKLQTSNSILKDFFIEKEPIYISINPLFD